MCVCVHVLVCASMCMSDIHVGLKFLLSGIDIYDRLWENPAYGIFCENRV